MRQELRCTGRERSLCRHPADSQTDISSAGTTLNFPMVIDALQHRGYQVVLTCGPSADDLACVDEIARGCQTPPLPALPVKYTFPELGALIDHGSALYWCGFCAGHIAAAVKTPVISLFGATDHVFWRPWTENIIQFWAGNYQKMPTRHELDRNKKYLSVIPAEDVIAATEKLLPEDAPSADRNAHYDRGILLI